MLQVFDAMSANVPGSAAAVAMSHPTTNPAQQKQNADGSGLGMLWDKPVVVIGSNSPVKVFAARAKSRGIRSLFSSTLSPEGSENNDSELTGHDSLGYGKLGPYLVFRAPNDDTDTRKESPRKAGFRWDTEETTGSELVDDVAG
jgi:hypothetical protein